MRACADKYFFRVSVLSKMRNEGFLPFPSSFLVLAHTDGEN